MNTVVLTRPEFAFILATRGLLGAGIGLLAAGRMSDSQRVAVGRALLAVGLGTTIPAAVAVFGNRRPLPEAPVVRRHGHEEL